eukprot:gene30980-41241_t
MRVSSMSSGPVSTGRSGSPIRRKPTGAPPRNRSARRGARPPPADGGPRPAGRGMKLTPSPVKALALQIGAAVAQPRSLRLDGKFPEEAQAARQALEAAAPDVLVVAAYGLILPQWTLDLPRLGCLNIHASLLPRWRGAGPIQAAILAGDAETGITVMQMDAGLDTGAMLLAEAVPITAQTTASSLHDALSAMGARLVLRALAENPPPVPQPETGATYAPKLTREDGRLDWSQPAEVLDRRIRALNPWPGTFCGAFKISPSSRIKTPFTF